MFTKTLTKTKPTQPQITLVHTTALVLLATIFALEGAVEITGFIVITTTIAVVISKVIDNKVLSSQLVAITAVFSFTAGSLFFATNNIVLSSVFTTSLVIFGTLQLLLTS